MKKHISLAVLLATSWILSQTLSAAVREPAVAGSFYPADSGQLAMLINQHLVKVEELPRIDGRIIALVVPHAGLVYSGQIAAHSYKLLEDQRVKNVILCGPSHRYGFRGLSVYGPDVVWKTPLGSVSCDSTLCAEFIRYDNIDRIPEAHIREHSLEVQLPYLQAVLDSFRIVPISMGYPEPGTVDLLAESLSDIPVDDKTVIVASTDWQHYRPADEGRGMDSLGIDCLQRLDPDRLERYLRDEKVEMCGGGATVAVLKAAVRKGANRVKVLRYGDSGDISGDKSSVVGYVAAVIYQSESADQSTSELPSNRMLSAGDKSLLLQIARKSIETYLESRTVPEFEVDGMLGQPGGAFVTLKRENRLRGCIGHTIAQEALYKTVSVCAVQAAVADDRFPPVDRHELDSLHIEISWLTPLQEIKSIDEIEVGRDGLMITLGDQRGLLLPQVATEYGWDHVEFLQHTCRKAGLPVDAYKHPDVKIEKFQAIVFGE